MHSTPRARSQGSMNGSTFVLDARGARMPKPGVQQGLLPRTNRCTGHEPHWAHEHRSSVESRAMADQRADASLNPLWRLQHPVALVMSGGGGIGSAQAGALARIS